MEQLSVFGSGRDAHFELECEGENDLMSRMRCKHAIQGCRFMYLTANMISWL